MKKTGKKENKSNKKEKKSKSKNNKHKKNNDIKKSDTNINKKNKNKSTIKDIKILLDIHTESECENSKIQKEVNTLDNNKDEHTDNIHNNSLTEEQKNLFILTYNEYNSEESNIFNESSSEENFKTDKDNKSTRNHEYKDQKYGSHYDFLSRPL